MPSGDDARPLSYDVCCCEYGVWMPLCRVHETPEDTLRDQGLLDASDDTEGDEIPSAAR